MISNKSMAVMAQRKKDDVTYRRARDAGRRYRNMTVALQNEDKLDEATRVYEKALLI